MGIFPGHAKAFEGTSGHLIRHGHVSLPFAGGALGGADVIAVGVGSGERQAVEAEFAQIIFVLRQPGTFAGMLEFVQLHVGQCRGVGTRAWALSSVTAVEAGIQVRKVAVAAVFLEAQADGMAIQAVAFQQADGGLVDAALVYAVAVQARGGKVLVAVGVAAHTQAAEHAYVGIDRTDRQGVMALGAEEELL